MRNPDYLKNGTNFNELVIPPAAEDFKGELDVLPIVRHTAFLERKSNLLFVFFLLDDEELTFREEVHYEHLARQGWVFVVVVWGRPPDTVTAIQVFDKEGKHPKEAAIRKELNVLAKEWWEAANRRYAQILSTPRRITILSDEPAPVRREPSDEWNFVSLVGSFAGEKVHAKDVDGGCIADGNVLMIEEKRQISLDRATEIAFEMLSRHPQFEGMGVLRPFVGKDRMVRYKGGSPSKLVTYSVKSLLKGVKHFFNGIVNSARSLLAAALLREELRLQVRVDYEVKRAGKQE